MEAAEQLALEPRSTVIQSMSALFSIKKDGVMNSVLYCYF